MPRVQGTSALGLRLSQQARGAMEGEGPGVVTSLWTLGSEMSGSLVECLALWT